MKNIERNSPERKQKNKIEHLKIKIEKFLPVNESQEEASASLLSKVSKRNLKFRKERRGISEGRVLNCLGVLMMVWLVFIKLKIMSLKGILCVIEKYKQQQKFWEKMRRKSRWKNYVQVLKR
jgi:hypothetical protein